VEYFLYQTLVGTWPISEDRLVAALDKSVHEMKDRTSWTHPDHEYDAAVSAFVRGVHGNTAFISDLEGVLERVVPAARLASLASTLLRLTAPGIPDVYQGSELWDERLVDPDNRASVDYESRGAILAGLAALSPAAAMTRLGEGVPKLLLIQRGL